MDLWRGKVAVVTGSASGLGQGIAKELCVQGLIVVGLDLSLERLNLRKTEFIAGQPDAQFHPRQCDLTKESEIQSAFDWIVETFGGVDVLVNNAGINKPMTVLEGDLDVLRQVVDTNLMAVVSCTKKAFKSMAERDVTGYIINICSVCGHLVPVIHGAPPLLNVYPSSKHGVRALNTVLRHELNHLKRNKIRISNVSPGVARSAMSEGEEWQGIPMLEPEDVASVVVYLLGTNPRVMVEDVIIRPNGEFFA